MKIDTNIIIQFDYVILVKDSGLIINSINTYWVPAIYQALF